MAKVCTLPEAKVAIKMLTDSEVVRVTSIPTVPRKVYPDGSIYEGQTLANGSREGQGRLLNRHGDVYVGAWQADKRSGFGVYEWKNGDSYKGEWKSGLMNGHGSFRWASGDRYVGTWRRGRIHGFGTKTMANGDSYTGHWKKDQACGMGCKTFACGDRHEGMYNDDKRHGRGIYVWSKGDVYEGEWVNGKMHGQGTKRMANGEVYEGEWYCNKAHGHGTKTFKGGDVHTGEYYYDRRQGFGCYVWVNKDRFEGWYENKQLNGAGTYYYANGGIFKGTWMDGKKHGPGIYTYGNKSVKEMWEKGVLKQRHASSKFYPPRVLRTTKDEGPLVLNLAPPTPQNDAKRIKKVIQQLRLRLVSIEGLPEENLRVHAPSQPQVSPREHSSEQAGGNTLIPDTLDLSGMNALKVHGVAECKESKKDISPSKPNLKSSPDHHIHKYPSSSSSSPKLSSTQKSSTSSSLSDKMTPPPAKTNSNKDLCKICFEAPVNTILLKCGHIAFCRECCTQLEQCPICRTQIYQVIETYRC